MHPWNTLLIRIISFLLVNHSTCEGHLQSTNPTNSQEKYSVYEKSRIQPFSNDSSGRTSEQLETSLCAYANTFLVGVVSQCYTM